jgi:dephospho-CoA kinase
MAMLVGLTGGIGSGKSTVAALLGRHGASLIDADAISRAATARGGAAIDQIAEQFGEEYLMPDQSLDRDRMRSLAFADRAVRTKLEAIVHPIVGAEIQRQVDLALGQRVQCIAIEIPLLVESGRWRKRLGRVLAVDCSEQTQVRRIAKRSGLETAQAMKIIKAQASRDARLLAADIVVQNDLDSMTALEAQVDQTALWLKI